MTKITEYKYEEGQYWISVLCNNCLHDSQLGLSKGTKVNSSHLRFVPCPRCKVKGFLVRAKWNGVQYVQI